MAFGGCLEGMRASEVENDRDVRRRETVPDHHIVADKGRHSQNMLVCAEIAVWPCADSSSWCFSTKLS